MRCCCCCKWQGLLSLPFLQLLRVHDPFAWPHHPLSTPPNVESLLQSPPHGRQAILPIPIPQSLLHQAFLFPLSVIRNEKPVAALFCSGNRRCPAVPSRCGPIRRAVPHHLAPARGTRQPPLPARAAPLSRTHSSAAPWAPIGPDPLLPIPAVRSGISPKCIPHLSLLSQLAPLLLLLLLLLPAFLISLG